MRCRRERRKEFSKFVSPNSETEIFYEISYFVDFYSCISLVCTQHTKDEDKKRQLPIRSGKELLSYAIAHKKLHTTGRYRVSGQGTGLNVVELGCVYVILVTSSLILGGIV